MAVDPTCPRERARDALSAMRTGTFALLGCVASSCNKTKGDPQSMLTSAKALVESSKELEDAARCLQKHVHMQHAIDTIQVRIADREATIDTLVEGLEKAEAILERVIQVGKKRLSAVRAAEKGSVDTKELVAYAHKISCTTAAPLRWEPGHPLGLIRPPNPQEHMMRAGVLYQKVPALEAFLRGEEIHHEKENTEEVETVVAAERKGAVADKDVPRKEEPKDIGGWEVSSMEVEPAAAQVKKGAIAPVTATKTPYHAPLQHEKRGQKRKKKPAIELDFSSSEEDE